MLEKRSSKKNQGSFIARKSRATRIAITKAFDFAFRQSFNPQYAHSVGTKFKALALGLALSFFAWLGISQLEIVKNLENQLSDLKVRSLADNQDKESDILVIAVDEQSLADVKKNGDGEGIGAGWTYPWPRFLYNSIIQYCEHAGAKAVVFDFLLSDTGLNTNDVSRQGMLQPEDIRKSFPDEAEAILKEFESFKPGSAGRPFPQYYKAWDDLFAAEATYHDNIVVGAKLSPSKLEHDASLREHFDHHYAWPVKGKKKFRHNLYGKRFPDLVLPLRQLIDGKLLFYPQRLKSDDPEEREEIRRRTEFVLKAATLSKHLDKRYRSALPKHYALKGVAGVGMVDAIPDPTDAIYRRYFLAFEQNSKIYPSLALEALRIVEGYPKDTPLEVIDQNHWKYGRHIIPVADDGSFRVAFHGLLPAEQVLSEVLKRKTGKGLSAAELARLYPRGHAEYTYPRISASLVMRDWEVVWEHKNWENKRKANPDLDSEPPGGLSSFVLGEPEKLFKDKIVLVAGTAAGLHDLRPNPLSKVGQGIELHAHVLDQLLNNHYITPVSEYVVVIQRLILSLFVAMMVIFFRRYWMSLCGTFLLCTLALGLSFVAWKWWGLEWPIAGSMVSCLSAFVLTLVLKFFTLDAHTRQMRSFSEQYMGTELVEYVLENPGSLKLGGEKRSMTIYFSDVAGFTTISEKLDPQELTELLNVYLSTMTQVILQSGGMVDKYIGDAVMAMWGAPKRAEDHAFLACRAALSCQSELQRLQPRLKEIAPQLIRYDSQKKPLYGVIEARVGINTGIVTAGNMGSHKRFSYTVMGDAVNQAARYEGANKEYGSWIMIGETTAESVRDRFRLRPLDRLIVKGKSEPHQVFELLAEGDMPEEQEKMLLFYEQGYKLYLEQQFEEAYEKFQASSQFEISMEFNPSKLYMKRCLRYKESSPGKDWNGVFVLKTK